MGTVFLICFLTGLLFALVSFFLGEIFHGLMGHGISFLSPAIIGAFITVFGGAGLFITKTFHLSLLFTISTSTLAALVASTLMLFTVVLPLRRGSVSAAKSQEEMIGQTAKIITPLEGKIKGEIVYEQGGSRFSSPAESVDGEKIHQGEEVEIVDVENGTFRVRKRGGQK